MEVPSLRLLQSECLLKYPKGAEGPLDSSMSTLGHISRVDQYPEDAA